MSLLSLNKTGLWTMLVLLLLGVSLYPACGRPAFEDENTVADEDFEEEDENQDGLQDEDQVENDDPTPSPQELANCEEAAKKKEESKRAAFLKRCKEIADALLDKPKKGGGVGGDSNEGTSGAVSTSDEYDQD